MLRHKKPINFDPNTKTKSFKIPTKWQRQLQSLRWNQVKFDPSWWNQLNYDRQHIKLVQFDPPYKNRVNFDPLLKSSQFRSPLYIQVNLYASTQTRLISIQILKQSHFDPHKKAKSIPSLTWNQVKFDPPYWNQANFDHPHKNEVNFDAHTKTKRLSAGMQKPS